MPSSGALRTIRTRVAIDTNRFVRAGRVPASQESGDCRDSRGVERRGAQREQHIGVDELRGRRRDRAGHRRGLRGIAQSLHGLACAGSLLQDMRQLVCHQPATRFGAGPILVLAEDDIVSLRIGQRTHGARGSRRLSTRVHSHVAEVVMKARLEEAALGAG